MAGRTLVVYASKYGTTEKYARIIADALGGDSLEVAKAGTAGLGGYDRIIVGSPVFAGQGSGKVKKFLEKNRKQLAAKETGAYICCMAQGEDSKGQLVRAYPEWFLKTARNTEVLGGEILLSKLKGLHKLIIVKMMKQEKDESAFSEENARKFAGRFI
ncbi:MAG: flavodoxin domain-containing protein [Spirochaetales bacterium]|nr:flavodoxin domain-containing protein [Spirochaetales bacterium]